MRKFLLLFCVITSALFLMIGCIKKERKADETLAKGVSTLENIQGTWEGAISIPKQPLPISVKFNKDGGTISIPVQGLNDYPLTNIKFNKENLSFEMSIQGQQIKFNGKTKQERITGTFTQTEQSFPFELTKSTEKDTEDGEKVQLKLKDGTMYGLLEMPKTEGPFPVMIIIAGSGPTDKDGNSPLIPGKNNSLKMLAKNLAEQGIASIRYDKRGIGNNSSFMKKEEDLQFDQYIDDAAAWVDFAQKDERFSKVGIIGHSEGSLIGMAAAAKEKADTFISLAGAGRPIDQVLIEQLERQLPSKLLAEAKDILKSLKQGKQVQTVSPELQSIFRPSVQPYMISWLKYNPVEQLEKLICPVLIVNGNRDLQVPASEAQALHQAKTSSKLIIIEKMNHILKDAPTDQKENMATYSNPKLPLSKGLIDGIIDFFNQSNIMNK
ncbi:hypothetical protein J6TS2_15820 [Heyndrickxia sporothermodurans]|nr:hypothetical protein J6TS2_15820 [Heyndrickxia sporothermodurans]